MSQARQFTFNASSFVLDQTVEEFLKSRGVISLDFGAMAYINSEGMPKVLSDLIEKVQFDSSANAKVIADLEAEIVRQSAYIQKAAEENARLTSQIQSYTNQLDSLKQEVAGSIRLIETLKAENARLQVAPKTQSLNGDEKLKQSYDKLQKDFQELRARNADSLTSLKVFEDENEELIQEIEELKKQSKKVVAPKTG